MLNSGKAMSGFSPVEKIADYDITVQFMATESKSDTVEARLAHDELRVLVGIRDRSMCCFSPLCCSETDGVLNSEIKVPQPSHSRMRVESPSRATRHPAADNTESRRSSVSSTRQTRRSGHAASTCPA